jgi:GntR family transcriptional regulator, trigonelline degradation regulator
MINQSSQTPLRTTISPIRKSVAPLRQQVVEELRRLIIIGRLPPGGRLIERELIAMLGVSRTVIREALRQLESEGLITMIPNKGPVVRDLTLSEARDLYVIRAVLEGLAARLFAENASQAQLEQLQAALILTGEAYDGGNPEQILEAKNHFYEVLFEGANSSTLSAMIATLHGRIRRWRALGLSHPQRSQDRSAESMRGLRVMLKGILARDGDLAERAIRDEVMRAANEVMRLLGAPSNVDLR